MVAWNSKWDSKSWDEITEFSDRIVEKAGYLADRLGAGGGSCSPEEVLKILGELRELVEEAKTPVEWAGE